MSSFPNSPKLIKGGLVLVDADTAKVLSVISLQYNSDSLTRTLQVQTTGGEAGDRIEAMRFKGPAVETFKLEADIDADRPARVPRPEPERRQFGIAAAARGARVAGAAERGAACGGRPRSRARARWRSRRCSRRSRCSCGARTASCRCKVTDFSITEEAFDPSLNPIRAKVSLGLRVLSIDDLGFSTKGGSLFMAYLQSKEQLAEEGAVGELRGPGHRRNRLMDPVQAFLQANALTPPAFPPTSRYYGIADVAADVQADGRTVVPTCSGASCRRRRTSRRCRA